MVTPLSPGQPGRGDGMPRIAIVGAGLAGLNAALTLQDAGFPCEIYEASNRLGGRIHSDTSTWAPGLVSDWCGEFIDREHQALWQLIARFGLETIKPGKHLPEQVSSLLYFSQRFQNAEDLAGDIQELAPLLLQQLQDAGFPTTHTSFTETGKRLDHLSVYEWVERFVKGGHTSLLGRLLDGGCRGLFGAETTLQSSLNLIYMFGPALSAPNFTPRSFMSGPMRSSYKIAHGNQRLVQSIAEALPKSVVHFGYQLVAIEKDELGAVMLTFATPQGHTTLVCDRVILTLPFSTLRHVDYQRAGFDELKQTAIAHLLYGTISKLFLEFDTPYWYQQGSWPRENSGFLLTDLEMQTAWDGSLGQATSGGLLVDYTSGARGAAYTPFTAYSTTNESEEIQQYARQCLLQLETIFPGISAHYTGHAALSYPTGDPYLQGSYSCWGVGQYTLFGGYEGARQGPIHFAGEHCSIEWQGYMEGAAREGARAAREILQDFSDEQIHDEQIHIE